MPTRRLLLSLALGVTPACADALPFDLDELAGARCLRMTPEPLAPRADDPHDGFKDVYACHDRLATDGDGSLIAPPYPDGTRVVKTARKPSQQHVWLVAVADKIDGRWRWAEYTRNFADEELLRAPVPESRCVDCHQQAAESDYIFTRLQGSGGG